MPTREDEVSAAPPLTRRLVYQPSPDMPPPDDQPTYCRTMLERYRKAWLSAWDKPVEEVVRWYSVRWDKFLVDLKRHRANELAGAPGYPTLAGCAQPTVEDLEDAVKLQVYCATCQETTTDYPPNVPVFQRVSGERFVDHCGACSAVGITH